MSLVCTDGYVYVFLHCPLYLFQCGTFMKRTGVCCNCIDNISWSTHRNHFIFCTYLQIYFVIFKAYCCTFVMQKVGTMMYCICGKTPRVI